jgi:hypothetical protein
MGYKVLLGIPQKEPIIEIKIAIALNGYSFFYKDEFNSKNEKYLNLMKMMCR